MDIIIEACKYQTGDQFPLFVTQEADGREILVFPIDITVKKVVIAKNGVRTQACFDLFKGPVAAVTEDKVQVGIDEVTAQDDRVSRQVIDPLYQPAAIPVALQRS